MTANIVIQNANQELLEAIKSVVKLANAKLKIEQVNESGYSDEFAKQIRQESEELDEEIANGTALRFKNMTEYRESIGE